MKKSVWDVLTNIAVFFKWFYIVCGIGIIVLLSVIITFNSCKPKADIIYYNDGLYIYIITEDDEAHIIGLTDKGKEQEYLIIPEEIDGRKVVSIGCNYNYNISDIKEKYGDEKYAQIKSENLKKIYITSKIDVVQGWLVEDVVQSPAFKGIMCISNDKEISIDHDNVYRSSYFGRISNANVSYYYNYENSPNNGYYWIDHYEYGKKIEFIPPVPTRDGYEFGGWYKESEFINKWNFDEDTLPDYLFSEGVPPDPENYWPIYQETKLYAKWIAIGGKYEL